MAKRSLTVCPSLKDSAKPRRSFYRDLPESRGILSWHFSPISGLPQSPVDRQADLPRLKPDPGYTYIQAGNIAMCYTGFHAHRTLSCATSWLRNPHCSTNPSQRSAPLLCRTLSFGKLESQNYSGFKDGDKVCSSHRLILWTFDLTPYKKTGSYRPFGHITAGKIRALIRNNLSQINYASWYDPFFIPDHA